MSELERKLAGGGLVITGEMPVIDGGGLDAVRTRLEQYEPWVDAVKIGRASCRERVFGYV